MTLCEALEHIQQALPERFTFRISCSRGEPVRVMVLDAGGNVCVAMMPGLNRDLEETALDALSHIQSAVEAGEIFNDSAAATQEGE